MEVEELNIESEHQFTLQVCHRGILIIGDHSIGGISSFNLTSQVAGLELLGNTSFLGTSREM